MFCSKLKPLCGGSFRSISCSKQTKNITTPYTIITNNAASISWNRHFHISHLSSSEKERQEKLLTSDRVSSVLNQLDEEVDDDDLRRTRSQRKLKLNKSLLRPPKKILDEASQGIYDSLGEDLADNMNEYLMKNVLFPPRRSNKPNIGNAVHVAAMTSDNVVEISTVSLNQDQSHAHAYWSSEPVEAMLKNMITAAKQYVVQNHKLQQPNSGDAKILKDNDIPAVRAKVSYQMALRMEKKLSEKLQRHEGKFRSHIIRTINMRRVPRIYFGADKDTKMLMEQLKAISEMDTL